MIKKITISLLMILAMGGCTYDAQENYDGVNGKNVSNGEPVMFENIKISNPTDGQNVASPLEIEGEAKGFWFFEASAPVRLEDESSNMIATGIIEAQGNWQTEEFVPFKGELVFETDAESGTLVFEKANPSGLPQNSEEVSIDVEF